MNMETFLREGVDLSIISNQTIGGDAHYFEDSTTPAKIRELLDSGKEIEKLTGMKLLLAMMSKGRDIPEFFPDVVKNVSVKSIEVKKMVYMYIIQYADYDNACREIALLSINSFQKDLSGPNPFIRGVALRVMTSIRVADIIQIQLLAVRKCANDSSPYVRKCAANALPKIFYSDPEQISHLREILDKLLKDASTMVLGSALTAFYEICPTDFELLHKHYRKLCHLLADLDEWTQATTLQVMTGYIRNQFTDPSPNQSESKRKRHAKYRSHAAVHGRSILLNNQHNPSKRRVVRKAFYSDEEDESDVEEEDEDDPNNLRNSMLTSEYASAMTNNNTTTNPLNHPPIGVGGVDESEAMDSSLDVDHRLILKSSMPLLKSRNTSVVIAVAVLHYYCGNVSNQFNALKIAKALVRILRNNREVQFVVLHTIRSMALERPKMFRKFLTDFFVKSTDPIFNKLLKLDIIASICTKDNTAIILREFQIYIKDGHSKFVCSVILAIGRIADVDPAIVDPCMSGLMHRLLCTKVGPIISSCVVVLRQLIQQLSVRTPTSLLTLHQLAKLLILEKGGVYQLDDPVARSSIIWLIGESFDPLKKVSPDILRILSRRFVDEDSQTRMQIVNFAAKLAMRLAEDDQVQLLATYILEMSRYDIDIDLRDRSRFLTALMGYAPSVEPGASDVKKKELPKVDEDSLSELAEHGSAIILAPKLPPVTWLGSTDVEGMSLYNLGSLSSIVGYSVPRYDPIPSWPNVQPDPNVRDVVRSDTTSDSGNGVFRTVNDENLKGFYGGDDEKQKKILKSVPSVDDDDSENDSEDDSEDEDEAEEDSNEEEEEEDGSSEESEDDIETNEDSSSSSESSESGSNSDTSVGKDKAKPSAVSNQSTTVGAMRKLTKKKATNSMDALNPTPVVKSVSVSNINNYLELDDSSQRLIPMDPFTPQTMDTLIDIDNRDSTFSNQPIFPSSMDTIASSSDHLTVKSMINPYSSATDNKINDINFLMNSITMTPSNLSTMNTVPNDLSHPSSVIPSKLHPPHPSSLDAQKNNETFSVDPEQLSEPKIILKPEVGGGLLVYLNIIRPLEYQTVVVYQTVILRVHNTTTDRIMRRVKITFPTDMRRLNAAPSMDVSILSPGQWMDFRIELQLANAINKSVKIDVRNDHGAFQGKLFISEWDLMCPLVMNQEEMLRNCRRLHGGFSDITKKFSFESIPIMQMKGKEGKELGSILVKHIQKKFSFYFIPFEILHSESSSSEEVLMGCGLIRKGTPMVDIRTFVTIQIPFDRSSIITVRTNCEDALLCSGLSETLNKHLSEANGLS